jgi:polygalacturonase
VVLYEQPNDPGAVDEGSMWIDTDSTVVPYVDEDEGGSGGDYENVRDHGAVGDGVTDDGDAIQAAIDAGAANGRAVYFPTGTYLISQQLNLHTGTVLEGAGRTSIIKLVGGYTENIDMIATANGDGTHDVTIRRLVVDGNKENISTEATWTIDTAPWTTCLHLLDVTNLVLEDLLIKNSTIEGVYLYHVHYGSVSRVEASENGFWRKDASGIHLDTCDHVVVDNSVTNHNGFHGIILSAATDNVIANHYAADNGFDGTRLQWSADRNRYEKFIAERNSRGIYVMHDSTLNHFTHCTLRDSLWNGFFSNNCRGNDLTFTHIEGSGEYAVGSVEAGDNQRGYGNTYRNNALGDYSLAAGSTFSTIAGAGEAI